ncbi:PKD domain-containing protein [Fluviicola sp.]|uniref:PKD domain-containing protein n=1 Tax=Fluviicola sp. TaxID=1917219 RepID=UPI003D2D578E
MKYKLLVIYFLVLALPAVAQNQHMNWLFGFGNTLNFSTGNPVLGGSNMMLSTESSASMNDANGNLLFYTNGIDVWSGNHSPMPNGSGLMGNGSSQCMIIPKPGNPGTYYIITTDAIEHACLNGLRYSEVDMNLNGGNGDVTTFKNVLLNAFNGEWITAVRHANCVDTWIITHGKDANSFFLAYHVSASGIDPVPVSTDLGIPVQSNIMGVGIMRPNPDGTKIAMSQSYNDGKINLIDFDKATGIATGISTLYSGVTTGSAFGLEFSRSGNRLYSSEWGNATGSIFQYDMTAPNIAATRIKISTSLSFPAEIGQLQIAPNDRIYLSYNAWPAVNFIGVITNPEVSGLACGFVENGVALNGTAMYGLPWYYNPDYLIPSPLELGPDLTICLDTNMTLSNSLSNVPGASYLWSDGSTSSTLQVSEPGTYWVQYQIESCLTTTDTITISSDTTQISHLVGDTSGCTPFTIQLTGISPSTITEWIWDFGNGNSIHTQNAEFTYTEPGTYPISLMAISANNCLVKDSVTILAEAFPVPTANFSFQPTPIKPFIPIQFTDQSTGNVTDWSWKVNDQPISTSPQCTYTMEDYFQPVTVSLTVTNSDGCSDEKKVMIFKPADLLYVPNTFTPDGNELNAVFKPVDYMGIVKEFTIYNRWGELIWSGTSARDGWDGTINGMQAPTGVYSWVITIATNDILSNQIQGHVNLVR